MLRAGIAAVHAALAIPAKFEKSEDGETTAAPTKNEVKVRWHFLCEKFFMCKNGLGIVCKIICFFSCSTLGES